MKKIIIATLFVAGVLMFSGCGSKVPQAFIDKQNESVALGKEAERVSDLNSMPEWNALNQQMTDGKYTDALKSIGIALGRKNDTATKLSSIDSKLAELNTLSAGISNAKVKAGAAKFIDISKKENSAKIGYNNLQIQMLEKLKAMVSILEKNPKAMSEADAKAVTDLGKQIDDIKDKFDNAEKEVDDIQSQYKIVEREFFGLAGLEIAK